MVTQSAVEGSVSGPVPALLFLVALIHYNILSGLLCLFVGKFMAKLGNYCNCSPASVDSAWVPQRGMRELLQSVRVLGRNLSFLGDDQGDV